jgi:glycosyltransferase involved in cell wall biosynthesis
MERDCFSLLVIIASKPVSGTMKLLIYTEYFAPIVGGVQTSLKTLAGGIAALPRANSGASDGSIEVTLVARNAANGFDDSSLPYRVVRKPGFFKLLRLIRDANVIHMAGPAFLPLLLSWLIRKPVAIEHHGYHAICPNGLLFHQPTQSPCPGHFMAGNRLECVRCCTHQEGWLRGLILTVLTFPRRWLCKKAAANIAITNHVSVRMALPHSETIYYGTALSADSVMTQVPAGTLEVAYVGRLVNEKGLGFLLEAAKRLNDEKIPFHLSFIGDGPERSDLESSARHFGLQGNVTFRGDLRDREFEEAIRPIHAVVMPSRWEETAGLAAIEQMMRGRLVIATDIGGLGEVVGDTGLKFAMGDSGALYSCLKRVIEKPDLIASLGQAARARALEKFSPASMISQHVKLYREIGTRRPHGDRTFASGAVSGSK